MMRCRAGLLIAAFLLSGCDHHKPANQAQAEAGSAAVATPDSDLTGVPPGSATPIYPRATLVSLPPGSPASTANPPPDNSNAPDPSSNPSTAANATASVAPPPEPTPPPAAATSSADDSVMPRLAINAASPVVTTNLTPTPENTASVQEQVAVLDTSMGRIVIELDDAAAPRTVANFRTLVADGFYNHTTFHRIIPHFIIQGGDPNSKSDDRASYGQGGPGYTLPAEIKLKHERGAVAMARLPDSVNPQRESNGSQFYICVDACPSLDNAYTVFGHVIKGLDVADRIAGQPRDAHDNPLSRIEMEVSFEPKDKALQDISANNP